MGHRRRRKKQKRKLVKHDNLVDYVYNRIKHNYNTIEKFVKYWDKHQTLKGELDILGFRIVNDKPYLVYYEIKTRYNDDSFWKAKEQYDRFKTYMKRIHPEITCKGVYVAPHKVIRLYGN